MKKVIDILYIHPTKSMETATYSIMPIGVVALMNELQNRGFSVYGINYGIEKSIDQDYSLEEELLELDYKVLMLDIHWYVTSHGAVQIAEVSKRIHPDSPIVVGGITATIFAEEIIGKFPCMDYIVKGDSHRPVLELMDYLVHSKGTLEDIPNICYRVSGDIIDKGITHICNSMEQLDFITVDFLKNNRYFFTNTIYGVQRGFKFYWINNGRGCMYNCSYCGGSAANSPVMFGRKKMLIRSAASLVQDIERLYLQNVRIMGFTHDFEMFDEEYYKKIFSDIRSKGFRISLQTHCNQIPTKEFLKEMLTTFSRESSILDILPLTGDEQVRNENGKVFSNAALLDILEFMAQNQLRVRLIYAMQVPNESAESFGRTLEQIEYLAYNYPPKLLKISCDWFIPDPISPARTEKKFRIKNNRSSFDSYYEYCTGSNENDPGYTDDICMDLTHRLELLNNLKDRLEAAGKKGIISIGSSVV